MTPPLESIPPHIGMALLQRKLNGKVAEKLFLGDTGSRNFERYLEMFDGATEIMHTSNKTKERFNIEVERLHKNQMWNPSEPKMGENTFFAAQVHQILKDNFTKQLGESNPKTPWDIRYYTAVSPLDMPSGLTDEKLRDEIAKRRTVLDRSFNVDAFYELDLPLGPNGSTITFLFTFDLKTRPLTEDEVKHNDIQADPKTRNVEGNFLDYYLYMDPNIISNKVPAKGNRTNWQLYQEDLGRAAFNSFIMQARDPKLRRTFTPSIDKH